MIANKKEFGLGLGMMAAFIVVLVIFFMPVFNGKNGMDYMDNLYNSISKGSAYSTPALQKLVEPLADKVVTLEFKAENPEQAAQMIPLFAGAGVEVSTDAEKVTVSGSLGKILAEAVADSDAMYHNDGASLSGRYGYDERLAMYNWYVALKGADKSLTKQKLFDASKTLGTVLAKGVETSYNYYKIVPEHITDRWGVVSFSLIFYVIYTMWYGYAIMFMFEGWGLKLSH
ncbi:MAG: hypothetical protein AB7D57_08060 [Desulfovibrionaceae bacterium]